MTKTSPIRGSPVINALTIHTLGVAPAKGA